MSALADTGHSLESSRWSSPAISDTKLSGLLKYHGNLLSYCRMPSLPIVIRFNVLKNTGFRPAPCLVPLSMNAFDFQCMKEALCDGVIIAGRSAPHATTQTVVLHQPLIILWAILAAPIRVEDRAFGEASTKQGHPQTITQFRSRLDSNQRRKIDQ